jgi:hypothetical protein
MNRTKWKNVPAPATIPGVPQPKSTYLLMLLLDERNKEIDTLKMVNRGLRADLTGMCTQAETLHKSLTSLRVSVARVAQAAKVPLDVVGIADDAPFEVIDRAARTTERGWNTLCAGAVHQIGHLHYQTLNEAQEQDRIQDRICEYYKLDRADWNQLDEIVQHALARVARNHGVV